MLQFFLLTGDTFSFQKGSPTPVKWYWGRPGWNQWLWRTSAAASLSSKAEAPTFSPKRWCSPGRSLVQWKPARRADMLFSQSFPSLTLQPAIRCVFPPKASQTPAHVPEHSSQVPNSAGQNQVCVPVTAAAAQRAQPTQPSWKSSEQEPSCMIWSSVCSHVATVIFSKDYL